MIKTTKNEYHIQERECEWRSPNLIIYGISEEIDNGNDIQFVSSFLETIGIALSPKKFICLSKPNDGKKRLKVSDELFRL